MTEELRSQPDGDRLDELPAQKAKPARPEGISVRLAQDADGPRIGELASLGLRGRWHTPGPGSDLAECPLLGVKQTSNSSD